MLTLEAFGALDIRDEDGEPLRAVLSQPKRAALLAYLALAYDGNLCRRDSLLALFWPESDQAHGRNALSQALSFLRRELGDGALVTRGSDEVGVAPDRVGTDVRIFEEVLASGDPEAALDAYQGDFLEGLHVQGAPQFVDWVDRERERLKEMAADAAWRCAHGHVAGGRLVAAERAAGRALTLVPTDESRVRAFVDALANAGDRAAALRFYERFAAVLAAELDVEPAPETVAVREAVRSRSHPVDVTSAVANVPAWLGSDVGGCPDAAGVDTLVAVDVEQEQAPEHPALRGVPASRSRPAELPRSGVFGWRGEGGWRRRIVPRLRIHILVAVDVLVLLVATLLAAALVEAP